MTRSCPARARPPPRIAGILNLTPDSFSDGGRFAEQRSAIDHALRMVEEGADVIDVGGESTRPRSWPVPAAEQMRRVLGVIEGLCTRLPPHVPISIDTTRADVAEAALGAGASLINDVSAGHGDPRMFGVAAARGVPLILMHMQGTPATMQEDPRYEDVVEEVRAFLLTRARAAEAAGIAPHNLIIDPGIGFGKTREHNFILLARLERLVDTGYAVMLGASRKRFMGSVCVAEEPSRLVGATCATTALGVRAGVGWFRVHDVAPNRQAADIAYAVAYADQGGRLST
ncbi:MAG: dihydropteroate synthase [Beggiatoa sp.]|nr:dihydropteroate synthase [Beggiatoa sp.]